MFADHNDASTFSGQQEWLHALELTDILIRSHSDECVVGGFPNSSACLVSTCWFGGGTLVWKVEWAHRTLQPWNLLWAARAFLA